MHDTRIIFSTNPIIKMDLFCESTSVDFHETKIIHKPWGSKIHYFVHSPSLRKKVNRKSANETSLQGQSLETLLSQKCGQTAFWNFLKSEFCEENLDFWLACEEFKTINCPEKLSWSARSIYEEFIRTESPKEINLDFYTRDIVAQNFQQPSPSCFVVAQRKVYSLMENDAFPRFIQSDHYKDSFDAAYRPRGSNKARLGKHRDAFKLKSNVKLI